MWDWRCVSSTYSADRERNRHDLTIVDRAGGGVSNVHGNVLNVV
jgi:hypothetical protein